MLTRILIVAAGGLGVAAVLDALLDSSDEGGDDEPKGTAEPGPTGDAEIEQRLDDIRSTIEGHVERLDDRVPDELGERIDAVLERVDAQRTASTDLLERLRSLEERLEGASDEHDDGGPTGGEPPEEISHDDGD